MTMERRDFLKLVGITGAGTLTACDQKVGPQALIPYLVPVDEITPGIPTWYASTCRECPAGCGVHVKTREGRVIKLEGNPESPVNRGKLCARGQAAHQNLYDPDRLKGPHRLDGGRYVDLSWDDATAMLAEQLAAARAEDGSIVFVHGLQTGTRERLYDEWARAIGATRVVYEPFAHEAILEAHRRVYGRASIPSYDIEGAEFVISFGADFLETWISPVRYAREWAGMHAMRSGEERPTPGIFVAVEPRLSMTASNADDWVSVVPGTEHLVALGMANALGANGDAAAWTPARVSEATGVPAETIERLARLFRDRRSVALPGGVATAHEHATEANAAIALLNQAGGAVGDTVRLTGSLTGAVAGSYRAMVDLASRLKTGQVRSILFSEANPVYALPPGLGFADGLRQVPFRASFSPHFDETAAHCHLLLPDHTPLESWGDWVPEDGVASLVQPAMRPVFNTRATPDVLLDVARRVAGGGTDPEAGAAPTDDAVPSLAAASWYDYLRAAWAGRAADAGAWADALKRGGTWEAGADAVAPGGQPAPLVGPSPAAVAAGAAPLAAAAGPQEAPLDFGPASFDGPVEPDTFPLIVFPQIAMYDGRNANRPWLQELPDPATSVSWQTWVEMHPDTADAMGLADGDLVAVQSPYGRQEAPVLRYPGIRPDVVAMPLGRGHTRMGRFADGRGVNPVELLPPTADRHSGAFVYQGVRVKVTPTGGRVDPLRAQGSDVQHDRGIAQAIPLAVALRTRANGAEHAEHGGAAGGAHVEPLTVERVARDSDVDSPYRWGMAISVDACIGCNACVAACSAENNLPFVGPERVAKSRQMHWIRIERYFEPKPDGGIETRHVPMLCQHCGAAPCEPVCPVYATYHNPEGLNVQVYNRCVGTRYCANNCPYKVRYFNWFTYEWPAPLDMALNPDVTVREKGVMEKCTFCVQRINAARNAARNRGPDARIREGDFQTACQQTCPTDAIVFGNMKDPASRAAQLAGGPLAYSVFEELNTRPANFYLRQVNERLSAELAGAVPAASSARRDSLPAPVGAGGE